MGAWRTDICPRNFVGGIVNDLKVRGGVIFDFRREIMVVVVVE